MELFDSHCHLDDEKFNQDREEVISHIFSSGVTKLISAGYSLEGSKRALEIAKTYSQIYTCVHTAHTRVATYYSPPTPACAVRIAYKT